MTMPAQYDSSEFEDAMLGDEPDWEAEPPNVDDPIVIDRMVARLARIRRRVEADREIAAAQVAQVNAWLEGREATAKAQGAWLEQSLRNYHEVVIAREKDRTSISLPHGTLKSTAGRTEWEVTDEAALTSWAIANAPTILSPIAIETRVPALDAPKIVDAVIALVGTESPLKFSEVRVDRTLLKDLLTRRDAKGKALKHGVTENGEEPPGLKVTEPDNIKDRTYTVVPNTPEQS